MPSKKPSKSKLKKFYDYVLSFYGPNQIYDYKFTLAEVISATAIYLKVSTISFDGDTIDRESVREQVFNLRRSDKKLIEKRKSEIAEFLKSQGFGEVPESSNGTFERVAVEMESLKDSANSLLGAGALKEFQALSTPSDVIGRGEATIFVKGDEFQISNPQSGLFIPCSQARSYKCHTGEGMLFSSIEKQLMALKLVSNVTNIMFQRNVEGYDCYNVSFNYYQLH